MSFKNGIYDLDYFAEAVSNDNIQKYVSVIEMLNTIQTNNDTNKASMKLYVSDEFPQQAFQMLSDVCGYCGRLIDFDVRDDFIYISIKIDELSTNRSITITRKSGIDPTIAQQIDQVCHIIFERKKNWDVNALETLDEDEVSN